MATDVAGRHAGGITRAVAIADGTRATDATAGFTHAWRRELCRRVLGKGFDGATGKPAGTL